MNARMEDLKSADAEQMDPAYRASTRIALVSLGCPKNLVDSEEILGTLSLSGFDVVPDCEEAEVIIINTCGFIEDAKQESIEAILKAAQYKKTGNCRSLIVVGCLAQRYAHELSREMPEIDAILGIGQQDRLPEIVRITPPDRESVDGGCAQIVRVTPPPEHWIESRSRIYSTPPWTAYLKISDGCDNRCAYCAIPEIRGRYRSRPPDLVLEEAECLVGRGVKEINLIGQDITLYGQDLGWSLDRLLGEIVRLDVQWVRLLYCYPTRFTDSLIERIASEPKICKYLDIPMQHGDDAVLRRMGRRGTSSEYLNLIRRLRDVCPDIALRTSFIVGFPGETQSEYANLLRFVEMAGFDRAGVFRYSREDGTPAAGMSGQVSRRLAEKRYRRLMEVQQRISLERNREFIGRTIDVLIETARPLSGRSYRDAPEIDGVVFLKSGKDIAPEEERQPGQMVSAVVTEAMEHDLIAVIEK